MALQYRTKGFIYKKRDRGEADRIFTVFTYDFGKIDIWARSIRKIDSKLKSGIDIFYLSEIEFVQGKKKTLTDAVLIHKFSDIIINPEKSAVACKIAKVLEAFIHGQEHDHEIFALIIETFKKLNTYNLPATSYNLIFIYFLWNFFAILGYTPELSNCAHCHGKLNEKELYFSNKDGGVVCKDCHATNTLDSRISAQGGPASGWRGNDTAVDSDVIKILRIILANKWETLLKLKINLSTQKELNNISKNYYLYLLSSYSFKK